MTDQFGVKKMAQILGAIEIYIYKNSHDYLPRQRSRFIDLCAIGLAEFEDDFFTYEQIKNLVVNMVNQYESSSTIKWRIDIDNCTAEQIAVICQPSQKRYVMPLNLFMASALTSN
ncbi:hypothetical protein [Candidatus Methylobacter oryzae]|uniref:Uncharacterized protein n=1 Tax=Candidatus Methylobacter oryzae TaxID=2497749 RepID=A0ABY3C581_9GAMM|nr:hypothetical protein [Candidatus Methylobacter oryzae]TRW90017.1 hypothetical protein EKO24_020575 [Candidatus Methylobacter oryzae]